ncbi:hypothetical protein FB107DRAFT_210071 [Schizophyllum commune]
MANGQATPRALDGPKRVKPLDMSLVSQKVAGVELETESPLALSDSESDDSNYDSFDESSPTAFTRPPFLTTLDNEHETPSSASDIQAELAALEELRRNVQKNLKLRPIRSTNNLRKGSDGTTGSSSTSPSSSIDNDSMISPASSVSSYYTPLNEHPPITSPKSARYIGPSKSPSTPPKRPSRPVDPGTLYIRLTQFFKRPLLIDTRPAAAHLQFHIRDSVNVSIPSLILKRCRKPGNSGFHGLDSLRQFITTDEGKALWDKQMHPGGPWDGDVILYDEEMDARDQSTSAAVAWALVSVLSPLVKEGNVDWLEDGLARAGHHPDLQKLVVAGADSSFTSSPHSANTGSGLTKLNTGRKTVPPPVKVTTDSLQQPVAKAPPSPLPLMPGSLRLAPPQGPLQALMDTTPSPPPSQVSFRRPPPPKRPSVPNLRKLDTSSAERLPKLSVNTRPTKSATLAVPPLSLSINPPSSPSHLTLSHSNFSASSPLSTSFNHDGDDSAYFAPPKSPRTPRPETPRTARPDEMSPQSAYPASPFQSHFGAPQTAFHTSFNDDSPSSAEDSQPQFSVSTILPNFLFLGPEMTSPEHVAELKGLGVQRIVNLAMECDKDDYGLRLGDVFDRYYKIAMRDIVEEDGIRNGVREVCGILGERLC